MTGEYDKVYLIYTHFQSALKQEVRFEEFLPLNRRQTGEETWITSTSRTWSRSSTVSSLITSLRRSIYALVESQTSEHAARMAAMENATNNCGEMIDYLTLVYNKTRQQSITNEMMDIVGGAEALQSS